MHALNAGTKYLLLNYGSEIQGQTLQFTTKSPTGGYIEGTTNEEVVNMMIDRFYELNRQRSSPDNGVIIELLKLVRQKLAQRVDKKITTLNARHEQDALADSPR